jgi:hypothetical protein
VTIREVTREPLVWIRNWFRRCEHNYVYDEFIELPPVKGKKQRKLIYHCCKCSRNKFHWYSY